MGFFSTFRDFVLGVDPTTGAAAESSGAHHPQQQARHAPGSTASKRTRTDDRDARAQSDAVSGKAVGGELPKGPGVLEELQAGTSGGIQARAKAAGPRQLLSVPFIRCCSVFQFEAGQRQT